MRIVDLAAFAARLELRGAPARFSVAGPESWFALFRI